MFTAMLSRPYALVVFLGFMLAFGAGWAVYELHFEQTADAPTSTTDVAAPEQTVGDRGGPEPPAEQAPAESPDVASAADQGAGEMLSDPASQADRPQETQSSAAGLEGLKAQVDRLKAEVEGSDPAPPGPREVAQTDDPEPHVQAGAPAPSGEPESSIAETAPETASAPTPPQPQPSITASVAEPESSEGETRSAAPPGDRGAAVVPAPPSGVPEAAADRDIADEPAPDPPAASQSAAMAPKPEPSEAPPRMAQTEGAAPPRAAEEEIALADPAPSTEEVAAPPAATGMAADPAPATSDAPGAGAAPTLDAQPDVADEAAPEASRLAETIRRAVSALFGGAMDEPAAGAEESEVAAVPEAVPEEPAPDQARAAAEIKPGAAPSFDIVRVEPGGRAVVAGRAAPGAEIELRSGNRVIDRVRADRRGEWVALPAEPLGAGVQELSLAARMENRPAVEAEEVVVVAVPGQPSPRPAAHATVEPPSQPVQVAALEPADEAFAVALPREGTGKGRILQAPGRISTDGALALVMLDYDDAGRIRLSGEASAGAALRIYVDNEPAGTAVVGPGGQWHTVLERTLTPGDYMLRLDQVGESGKPDARLETPFTRVSHPPVEGDVQVDYVIVQPGNSLWRIARRVLGEGTRYVHIYEANQAQIRDPDLIYPGQVFEVPSGTRPAG